MSHVRPKWLPPVRFAGWTSILIVACDALERRRVGTGGVAAGAG